MSTAYQQLLDAALRHLEDLKSRGVRFASVSAGTLAGLAQPPPAPTTPMAPVIPAARPASTARESVPMPTPAELLPTPPSADVAPVRPGLDPAAFTIRTIWTRLAEKGDLFAGVLSRPQRMEEAIERLSGIVG